jgi:tetratricopeptide (TPR) repeat protein
MDTLTVVGIIAAIVGTIAGIVQVLDYLQKRREKPDEPRLRPGSEFMEREADKAAGSRIRIYVSSTHSDLVEHRQRVYDILRKMRYDVIAMEDYVAADERPLDKCLADVASCDLYIGIFAWRYGYIPPGQPPDHERSITELEYRQAGQSGLERLIFLLDKDAPWPRSEMEKGVGRERIEALRAELAREHTVQFFKSPEELAEQVAASVAKWAQAQLNVRMDALRARRDQADRERHEMRERQRVVNLRPLDVTHFKDRLREIQALCDHLADASVRLVSVVGRGGMGKTALASRVLADLERGILPVPGEEKELSIDGILYLSARSTGLGLERIYTDVGRMLGEPAASKLAARWAGDAPLASKVEYLFETMRDGLYLILLDNLEEELTEEGVISEEGLRLFVERCLTQPDGVRLVVTSREEVKIASAALHSARCIPLREGLPEDDAVTLLRDLDPQGTLGLRDAPEGDLRRAAQLTRGIPRALEILAGILHRDPTASLPRLLADEATFGAEVVERLVAEGYRRLREDERRIMEALAVFDRPADETAIGYLLYPWFPGLDVRAGLRRLVSGYFVSVNRVTGEYSLHPLDREYAYRQIPDETERGEEYTQRNLELRAADFYASIRKPESEWKTIEDLAPQLAEFEHRVRAGDYDGACRVLKPIDSGYLDLWGHYTRLVEIREKLLGRLTDPNLRAANLGSLGNAYRPLGQVERTIEFYEQALVADLAINDRQGEGRDLSNLGRAYHDLGQFKQAIRLLEEALAIDREIGDRREEGGCLGTLGLAYRDLGQIRQAIKLHEGALAVAREIGDRRNEGVWLGYLGLAYRDLGQVGRAIKLYEEALVIAREIGHRPYEGVWLGNLGIAYCDLGQIERAIKFHEEARAIAREIGDRRREGRHLGNLGIAYCNVGQFEQAIKLYGEALVIAREIGHRREKSRHLLGLGKVLLATEELSAAKQRYAEALALEVPETSYKAAVALGIVLLHQRDPADGKTFTDAAARCQAMLDKTASLYEARYALAASLIGSAVCDPRWAQENERAGLLALALAEYRRALENCAAPGVVRGALRDLEMIHAAGVEGLEPAFELLESARP